MNKRVLVFGSCVSRDVFNIATANEHLSLVDYFARSSFASIGSAPVRQSPNLQELQSKFQQKAVARDFSKEFLSRIKKNDYDILLIDFIDERFNLLSNGANVITRSAEFVKSKVKFPNSVLVQCCSDKHFQLWQKGWSIFIQQMYGLGLLHKVRINKVFWAERLNGSKELDWIYSKEQIEQQNNYLRRLYEFAEKNLTPEQFLEYNDDLLLADEKHQWGQSPFHFVPDLYEHALQQILSNRPIEIVQPQLESLSSERYSLSWFERVKKKTVEKLSNFRFEPVKAYDSIIQSFVDKSLLTPGEKILKLKNGECIEFNYWEPKNFDQKNKKLFICFTAAVGQRELKSAPFFSGVGIARHHNTPILCIADPIVSMHKEVGLAWYAGGEKNQTLQLQLKEVLEQLYLIHKKELIIFGGSGGGFASLIQASILDTPATVVVWNPQTSILKYYPNAVRTYIQKAFLESIETKKFDFKQALEWFGIKHEVFSSQIQKQIKLIYLQNQSDNHTQVHAVPFMKDNTWDRLGDSSFKCKDRNLFMYFGSWGRGHATPDRGMLNFLLSSLLKDRKVEKIIQDFEKGNGLKQGAAPFLNVSEFSSDVAIELFAVKNNSKIDCKVELIGADSYINKVEYSFRLRINDKVVLGRDYKNDSTCCFNYEYEPDNLNIEVRLKDGLGNILRVYTDVVIQI